MKNKKTWSRTLAVFMALMMLMSAMVFTVPVNAESTSISLKRVDDADIVIDGKADDSVWEEIPSGTFSRYWGTISTELYSYKAAWGTDAAGNAYVYFLIETTDANKGKSTVYMNTGFAKDANWANGNMGINPDHKAAFTVGDDKCVAEYRMALSYLSITEANAVGAEALLNIKITTATSSGEATINGKDPGAEAVSFRLTDEKIVSDENSLMRVDDIEIDIDGHADDEAWSLVPFRSFKKTSGSTIDVDKYSYKLLWGTDSDTNKSYVYILIVTTDPSPAGSSVYVNGAFAKDSSWANRTVNNYWHNAVLSPAGATTSVVEYRMHLDAETVGSTYSFNVQVANKSNQTATINGLSVSTPVAFTLTDSKVEVENSAHDIKRVSDSQIVIDGEANDEAWSKVPARAFKTYAKWESKLFVEENYTYKTLWGTDSDGKAYLYILLETADTNAGEVKIYRVKSTDGSTMAFQTDINWSTNSGNIFEANGKWAQSNTGNGYIAEFRIPLEEGFGVDSTAKFNIQVKNVSGIFATFNSLDLNNFTSFKLTDERIEIERTLTLVDQESGETLDTVTVIQGEKYTLPTANTAKPFLGWLVEGTIYPAGAKIAVNENTTIRAYSLGLEMEEGAAVRLTETTGMRWITYFDEATLPFSVEIVQKGTLIVPVDYLTDDVKFTHADLEAAGRKANQANGYLDVVATEYVPAEHLYKNANGRKQFNGSIVEIQAGNYGRNFAAVGYVKVRYANGTEAYIYADYSKCVRNVKDVATGALADTTVTYNAAETALLKNFAGIQ